MDIFSDLKQRDNISNLSYICFISLLSNTNIF